MTRPTTHWSLAGDLHAGAVDGCRRCEERGRYLRLATEVVMLTGYLRAHFPSQPVDAVAPGNPMHRALSVTPLRQRAMALFKLLARLEEPLTDEDWNAIADQAAHARGWDLPRAERSARAYQQGQGAPVVRHDLPDDLRARIARLEGRTDGEGEGETGRERRATAPESDERPPQVVPDPQEGEK